MDQEKTRKTPMRWIFFVLFGLVYFSLFIVPNLQGAQNLDMLAIFEIDEFAQYPYLVNMLKPSDSVYQSIRNFAVYSHYFYGYPFYFFSAIVALPFRLIFGTEWGGQTQAVIVVLRQMISVLPMIAAVGVLVGFKTRYQSFWRSFLMVIGLLALPSVVRNNLWWHPDSLAFLFVALTFLFLDRDQFDFGKFFFFAAASAGLALGTKHMGEFFVAAIPVYLIWGIMKQKIRWQRAALFAVLFVVVMLTAVVISNPLLLLPQERAEIFAIQKRQFFETTQGSLVANGSFDLRSLQSNLGQLWFLGLALIGLGVGFYRQETRLQSVLITCWLLPLSYVIFFASPQRSHYYLNLGLPLYLCLENLFFIPASKSKSPQPGVDFLKWVKPISMGLILVQFVIFLRTDISMVQTSINRETTSPAIQFYAQLESDVFARIPEDGENKIVVYRDWKIYCPAAAGRKVVMDWGLATPQTIRELNPDIIILEAVNIKLFSASTAEIVGSNTPGQLQQFYTAAAKNTIDGYQILIEDNFATVLVKETLYQQYFGH